MVLTRDQPGSDPGVIKNVDTTEKGFGSRKVDIRNTCIEFGPN